MNVDAIGNVTPQTPTGVLVGVIQTSGYACGGLVLQGFRSDGKISIVSSFYGLSNPAFGHTFEVPTNTLITL